MEMIPDLPGPPVLTAVDEMDIAILYIDRSSSICGTCSEHCNPVEKSHETVLGYGGPTPGCGVQYTHVSSHYVGMKEACLEMRPDLEWID